VATTTFSMINNMKPSPALLQVQLVSMRSSISLDSGDRALGGLLKATAVLSTIGTLSTLAFLLGLLGSVERIAQTGYFGTQSYGFLLSLGIATGFLISAAVVRGLGRRNRAETNPEDPLISPETETA